MAVRKNSPTKRSLNALETRNKLYSTALMLFTKHGFDRVTVDDITRYAGVSKGTFYNHFTTKDQVLVEQYHQIDNHYEQALRRMSEEDSVEASLFSFVDAMCEYCENVWGLNLLKIVYMNQINLASRPELLLRNDRPFYTLLTKIIQKGRDRGEISTEMSLEEQVYLFARSARSVLYEWCLHDGKYDLKKSGREIFRLAIDNVAPR